MTEPDRAPRLHPAALAEAWQRFWFHPEPAYTLGLIRIAFGALMVAWTVSLLPNLNDLFGGMDIVETYVFRVTRVRELEVDEDLIVYADDPRTDRSKTIARLAHIGFAKNVVPERCFARPASARRADLFGRAAGLRNRGS